MLKTIRTLSFVCVLLLPTVTVRAQFQNVLEWTFDRKEPWTGANFLKNVHVQDGTYRAEIAGADPFLSAAGFEFEATPFQAVELRYRTNRTGKGELYYTNTNEGQYGGFSPKKMVHWDVRGDESWHIARIFPGWSDEKKIIKLRIDFPNLPQDGIEGARFEIDWIRVINLVVPGTQEVETDWSFLENPGGWKATDGDSVRQTASGWNITGGIESGPMTFDADQKGEWIALEMSVVKGTKGTVRFFNGNGKLGSVDFPLRPDGLSRWYNVDMSKSPEWFGTIHLLELLVDAEIVLKRWVVAVSPQGPADVVVEQIYQTEAVNRVGRPSRLAVRLRNDGGTAAKNVRIAPMELRSGMSIVRDAAPVEIAPNEVKTVTLELTAEKPVDDRIVLATPAGFVPAKVRIDENLKLPKADYVPKPQPVRSDYEIGALYFPGWKSMDRWAKIYRTHPERKPVLGWYDEADPEVIDWQIKWSLENGIQYYFVDWYWHKGHQYLDHWVNGFRKARYKSMFKWAMMWANHNAAGSHSEEDMRAVTKFWIENYFNTPEYYTRDGKPVVLIWSPTNFDRDMAEIEKKKGHTLKKGEGAKRLLDISQEMAKEAGYKGIFFIAMKWPEISTDPKDIQWLADAGFEMTSLYRFLGHGGKAENPLRFPFELVVEASLPYLESRHKAGILPFLPNVTSGWDSRPWHGDRQTVIHDRTVDGFRRICDDAKSFCERTNIRDIVLGPTNEWGEGSYVEPNAEYGFGMFETVRNTFCKMPETGWPLNYGPSDVGLGPYDLPPLPETSRLNWDFNDGPQGWNGNHHLKVENGILKFKSTSSDPIINTELFGLRAKDFSRLVVRMKVTADDAKPGQKDSAQVFWSTESAPISESTSVRVPVDVDGAFHDYIFDLKSNRNWRRTLNSLRFDPVATAGLTVEIDSIRFEKGE